VLSGITFVLRSFGIAYNEVVVALLERRGAWSKLQRFGLILLGAVTLAHGLIATRPVSFAYFSRVSALSPLLAEMAMVGFWIALPMPALAVLQNLFQGTILHGRRTRGIPESMVIFFVTILASLAAGAAAQAWPGLYVGMTGLALANAAQMLWLWKRSLPVIRALQARDAN
jgi:hypothetical protein